MCLVGSTTDAASGVARKTANVVAAELGHAQGVVVDTHVRRLSQRLGLTRQEDPVKIERDLQRVVPRADWSRFPHLLIWHGRRVCDARRPRCEDCVLVDLCPSARIEASSPPERSRRLPSPRGLTPPARVQESASGAHPALHDEPASGLVLRQQGVARGRRPPGRPALPRPGRLPRRRSPRRRARHVRVAARARSTRTRAGPLGKYDDGAARGRLPSDALRCRSPVLGSLADDGDHERSQRDGRQRRARAES